MQIFILQSVSQVRECSDFLTFSESVTEKIILDKTDTSVEHPLTMNKITSNEIINMINEENSIIALVQGKNQYKF